MKCYRCVLRTLTIASLELGTARADAKTTIETFLPIRRLEKHPEYSGCGGTDEMIHLRHE